MSKREIKSLVSAVASEADTLRQLNKNPEAIAKKFGLKQHELAALRTADKFLVIRSPLAGTTTYTFTTGSTITARLSRPEISIGPKTDVRELFEGVPKKP